MIGRKRQREKEKKQRKGEGEKGKEKGRETPSVTRIDDDDAADLA